MSVEQNDIPKYRKRRNQKSKSKKRSRHKHEYEKVIIGHPGGWGWGKKCIICGKMEQVWSSDPEKRARFRKLERVVGNIEYYEALSVEELKEKFPDFQIYKMTFENGKYLGFREVV